MTMPRLLTDIVCPMFGDVCRHCSLEITIRPFAKIKKNLITGLFEPDGQGSKKVELGEFCNNSGIHYVRDLHYCPRRWALRGYRYPGLIDDECTLGRTHGKLHSEGNKKLSRNADVPPRTRTGAKGTKVLPSKDKTVRSVKTRRMGSRQDDHAHKTRGNQNVQQTRNSPRYRKKTNS